MKPEPSFEHVKTTSAEGYLQLAILLFSTIELEENFAEQRHTHYYTWDRSGRRLRLTSNYGNPAHLFADVIRDIVPDVQEIKTRRGAGREKDQLKRAGRPR